MTNCSTSPQNLACSLHMHSNTFKLFSLTKQKCRCEECCSAVLQHPRSCLWVRGRERARKQPLLPPQRAVGFQSMAESHQDSLLTHSPAVRVIVLFFFKCHLCKTCLKVCVLLFCFRVVLQSPVSNAGLLVLQRGTLLCSIQAALKTCQLCSSLKFMRPQVGTAERRFGKAPGESALRSLVVWWPRRVFGIPGPHRLQSGCTHPGFFLLEWKQDELVMSFIS